MGKLCFFMLFKNCKPRMISNFAARWEDTNYRIILNFRRPFWKMQNLEGNCRIWGVKNPDLGGKLWIWLILGHFSWYWGIAQIEWLHTLQQGRRTQKTVLPPIWGGNFEKCRNWKEVPWFVGESWIWPISGHFPWYWTLAKLEWFQTLQQGDRAQNQELLLFLRP